MWAEYRGEKVFVCSILGGGIGASTKEKGYFFIPFDELTPTTALDGCLICMNMNTNKAQKPEKIGTNCAENILEYPLIFRTIHI